MGRRKNPAYCCPRCGYETEKKSNMRLHFNNKHGCIPYNSHIELNDEVKETVLRNRTYKVDKGPPPSTTNMTNNNSNNHIISNICKTINNNNQIYNIVANFDTVSKIEKFMEYKNIDPVEFETRLEQTFGNQIRRLENNEMKPAFRFTQELIMDHIQDATKPVVTADEFNFSIIYDDKEKTIMIYEGQWDTHRLTPGIRRMFEIFCSVYWNVYERFLVRKYHEAKLSHNMRHKALVAASLQIYYGVLASVDLEPHTMNKTDSYLLAPYDTCEEVNDDDLGLNLDELYSLEEDIIPIYRDVKESLTKRDRDAVIKEVVDILKVHAKDGIRSLNQHVSKIFSVDAEFAKSLHACNEFGRT